MAQPIVLRDFVDQIVQLKADQPYLMDHPVYVLVDGERRPLAGISGETCPYCSQSYVRLTVGA